MDPHALALLYHTRVVYQIYDALVSRDDKFKLEPALATVVADDVDRRSWRFKLRPGVVFHDGSAVHRRRRGVLARARAGAAVAARVPAQGRERVRKIDALTIEIQLEAPDAVLPEKLAVHAR